MSTSARNSNDVRPRVAVLGAGIMGSAMTRRLLAAGLPVSVWNRSPQSIRPLTDNGATWSERPEQAVASADVVITMLPDQAALASVMTPDVIAALQPEAIWAQMGTIGVHATREIAADTTRRRPDVRFVDAPVSGSREPAENGQLTVLASGPDSAQVVLKPVFEAVGGRTLWLGAAGAGSAMKLVLNTWLAFLVEGIAESAALADALGLPSDVLREALAGGPLAAPAALGKLGKIRAGDDAADFSLRWAAKDIDLAVSAGGDHTIPVAAAIGQRWRELIAEGLGDADVSAARHGLGQLKAPARLGAQPELTSTLFEQSSVPPA